MSFLRLKRKKKIFKKLNVSKFWRVLPGVRVHGSAPGGGRPSLNSPKAIATTPEAVPKLVGILAKSGRTKKNKAKSKKAKEKRDFKNFF